MVEEELWLMGELRSLLSGVCSLDIDDLVELLHSSDEMRFHFLLLMSVVEVYPFPYRKLLRSKVESAGMSFCDLRLVIVSSFIGDFLFLNLKLICLLSF